MNNNPPLPVVPAAALSLPNPLFVWTRVYTSLTALLVFSSSLCHGVQSCALAWNASSDTTVSGYRVRYGTTSGSTAQTKDAGNATSTTISGLSDGITYYFTVVAYTSTNVESQPSNEVSYKTPTTPTAGTYNLTVVSGTGDGPYAPGTTVPVSANSPGSGQTFSIWTGDYQILANRTSSATTATMPSMDATITATYTGTSSLPGGTTVSDDFNRANSGTLGASWTQGGDSISIDTNAAFQNCSGTARFGTVYWASGSFSNNQFSKIEWIDSNLDNNTLEAGVRMSGSGGTFSGYFGTINGDGGWSIYKAINGSDTPPLTSGTTTAPIAGDAFKTVVSGTTITFYKNGTSIGSTSDSSLTSGKPGFNMYCNTNGATFHVGNWSGGDGAGP